MPYGCHACMCFKFNLLHCKWQCKCFKSGALFVSFLLTRFMDGLPALRLHKGISRVGDEAEG